MKTTFNLKEITPCLTAVFVDILGMSVAFPLLTAIFTSGKILPNASESTLLTYLAIGFILYPLFMFFGSSFMGDLSDIIGRKKVLTLCMGGFTLGFAMTGLGISEGNLILIFLGRALTGLTAASLPVTMAAISDLSTPNNKAAHMSLVVLVQSIGFILGPLMAGFLSNPNFVYFFNASTPFYISSFLALIVFLWISFSFQETFKKKVGKKIEPLRIIFIFIEAFKHSRIRTLMAAFLLHQIGIGLFIQLILIFLNQAFHYTSFEMGIFNTFTGICLGFGTLFIAPLAKKFRIEWIACGAITLLGLSELFASNSRIEILLWISGALIGIFGNIAWSAILTSFSEAVDSASQGWALGITGAIVALSFILTGLAPSLVPYFGVMPLIGVGGICTLIGAGILLYYCKKKIR